MRTIAVQTTNWHGCAQHEYSARHWRTRHAVHVRSVAAGKSGHELSSNEATSSRRHLAHAFESCSQQMQQVHRPYSQRVGCSCSLSFPRSICLVYGVEQKNGWAFVNWPECLPRLKNSGSKLYLNASIVLRCYIKEKNKLTFFPRTL